MDSITTLIVEDEPMLAEILVDTIKQFPQFEVIGIADKLESAKKMLRLYQPQLTLLDNFLPDGKGLDLSATPSILIIKGASFSSPPTTIWIPSAKPCGWAFLIT